jgi:hypothetical protein
MNPLLTETRSGRLRIWSLPQDSVDYVVGVDIAEGKVRDKNLSGRKKVYSYGDNKPDLSAAIVIRMDNGEHVATWHGHIRPHDFVGVIIGIGYHFNTALLVPEVNGPGIVVVTALAELEYPNVYQSRVFNYIESDGFQDSLGWRTTPQSRPLLVQRIHEIMAVESSWTRDRILVDELRTMEIDDAGVPRARGSNKDDTVLALGMALQGRHEYLVRDNRTPSLPKDMRPEDRVIWERVHQKQEQLREYRMRLLDRGRRGTGRLRGLRPG